MALVSQDPRISYAKAFARAKRGVVYGAALLGAITGFSATASIVTASLSPASAQAIMVTPPLAISPPSAPITRAIPKEQCNYLFDTVTDSLKKHGKDYVSDVTRVSLRRFFESVPGSKVIDCAGPREIAWQTNNDYALVIAFADDAGSAFKGKVDFRMDYGLRPAAHAANPALSEAKSTPAPGS